MNKTLRILFTGVLLLLGTIGSKAQVLFTESFTAGTLPAGWTNDSLGSTPLNVWIFNNQYLRAITGAGFDTHFAMFDSDEGSLNDNIPELASLTTPSIDISGATSGSLYLEMDEQYKALSGPLSDGSSRNIEYSTDGGTSWTVLVFDTVDYGFPNPAVHSQYDLSPLIGVASNLLLRFTWTGTWDWWWAIDNVQVINYLPCNAPPNAGTTVADLTSVCSTDSIHLSLSGADVASGLSYQWQNSPDGLSWSDILGATGATVTTAQSASTYYQCVLTCSGQPASSVPLQVVMNAPTSCYCTPAFSTGCDAIAKVAINTLYNESGGCNGNPNNYINYPDTGTATTSLEQGLTYTFTFASGPGSGSHGAGVWFDFDHNGDFQGPGEYFHLGDAIIESSPDTTISIQIPIGASLGATRMRVHYMFNTIVTVTSDCEDGGYGETEDYTVHIILPVGINEAILNSVSVYPSPATDQIRVNLGQLKGSSVISVVDLMGKTVFQNTVENQAISRFDCSSLTNGIYFVRVENSLGSITRKILVSK